jgi:hypothetical protein
MCDFATTLDNITTIVGNYTNNYKQIKNRHHDNNRKLHNMLGNLAAALGNFTDIFCNLATNKIKLASVIGNLLITTCNFTTAVDTFTL